MPETFAGASWHTARWPEDVDLKGKRVAVIGTGCTGYQMVPEIALEAAHVTVFQRTAQWLFPVPGYRSPFPPQVNWLDRNLPFHTNFMRARTCSLDRIANVAEIDPDFKDPYAVNPLSKRAREGCVAFLERKLGDPALVAAMTPPHPIWSARAVVVDPDYCVLDALLRDNVTLVTAGIERIEPRGIVAMDGTLHEADVIVYATGFHATEYLYPMTITGRGGQTLEDLWAKDGARAYLGCMMPGFPNLWSIYGPNTNGALPVASFHEKTAQYALQCMETLVLGNGGAMEVRPEAFWRYNRLVDERNLRKVWSDPRAHNYYWTEHGRSATMNPFYTAEMSGFLRKPDLADLLPAWVADLVGPQPAAGVTDGGSQVVEHRRRAVLGDDLAAVRHIGLKGRPHPRPVGLDHDPPVLFHRRDDAAERLRARQHLWEMAVDGHELALNLGRVGSGDHLQVGGVCRQRTGQRRGEEVGAAHPIVHQAAEDLPVQAREAVLDLPDPGKLQRVARRIAQRPQGEGRLHRG